MLKPGTLRLGLDVTGTHVETSHDVPPEQFEKDPATGLPRPLQARSHEVTLDLLDFSLSGSLALRSWLALEARVPLRLVVSQATFRDDAGNELEGFDSIHHRDETLFGLGDIELWDRFRLAGASGEGPTTLDLRAGVALPTGNIVDDPYLLGAQGREHQHVFFGSGTLDPLGGVDWWQRFDGFTLNAYVSARGALYHNPRGYRAGARGSLGAALQSGLGLSRWLFHAGPELYYEAPSSWESGAQALEDEASDAGRTSIIASLGAVYAPSDELWLRAQVKRPFSLSTGEAELEIPFVATLGVTFGFPVWEESHDDHDHGHDHDHDHGHGHDEDEDHDHEWIDAIAAGATGTGDVVDLAVGGKSFDREQAVEPGRVTVVDFWAEWCEPCHDIDALLRALAKKHPNLAVRRVEIVDFDSPAAVEHLKGAKGLPVIWIYDSRGRRVETLVATSAREVHDRLIRWLKHPASESLPTR